MPLANHNLLVAKIGKTVGLKGQLKLHIDSDFPEQFKKDAIFITHKNQKLQIETVNLKNKLVKFIGIDTIEDAKRYINSQLLSTQEDTVKNCKLKDKQFFWFDIIDCDIIENGKLLGKVSEVHRYPIDDYLEVVTTPDMINQDSNLPKTFLIPYNDNYIVNVNLETKEIHTINTLDIMEAS